MRIYDKTFGKCSHCAICDLDRHCRRLRISGHYNLFSMGDFQCGGDSH